MVDLFQQPKPIISKAKFQPSLLPLKCIICSRVQPRYTLKAYPLTRLRPSLNRDQNQLGTSISCSLLDWLTRYRSKPACQGIAKIRSIVLNLRLTLIQEENLKQQILLVSQCSILLRIATVQQIANILVTQYAKFITLNLLLVQFYITLIAYQHSYILYIRRHYPNIICN